jgi:glyoxylase-like metal-dependent hydrolase (beta-lactamase superfamily II)
MARGDENGNGMVVRIHLPSGHKILGLPTENNYGGEWDLGPTWNYLVSGEHPFLVDTGKSGMGKGLIEMMRSAGVSENDIAFVLISHGHEDHDGSLAEFVAATGIPIKAHEIYGRLIRFYDGLAPNDAVRKFPALCWRCFMPESFTTARCLDYQKARSRLTIEPIKGEGSDLGADISVHHVPGHSPDSLAVSVAGAAVLVGDTVLPEITPWPSQEALFDPVREILNPPYGPAHTIYGLRAYLRSLAKLKGMGNGAGDLIVLPAHRLFYGGRWNDLDLSKRVDELTDHHIQRCGDILEILKGAPKTDREIALEYFDKPLLKGFGVFMAEREVLSHCELLAACGDVMTGLYGEHSVTGEMNFETLIRSITAGGAPADGPLIPPVSSGKEGLVQGGKMENPRGRSGFSRRD